MGWISERAFRRGSALYSQGPKRKGPLKRLVCVLHGDHATNLFGHDWALLECGHTAKSFGGKRAICESCKLGKPVTPIPDWHVDHPLSVAPAPAYEKNFTADELEARKKLRDVEDPQ